MLWVWRGAIGVFEDFFVERKFQQISTHPEDQFNIFLDFSIWIIKLHQQKKLRWLFSLLNLIIFVCLKY